MRVRLRSEVLFHRVTPGDTQGTLSPDKPAVKGWREVVRTKQTITREELYERVWEKPMNELAREFGLSDVGLTKICNRLGVPRPPQGYWIKKEHGKALSRPALPVGDYPASHTIYPTEASSHPTSEALQALKVQERAEESRIVVPDSLENPHRWIAAAQKEFKRNSKRTGLIGVFSEKRPDLCTSHIQAPRALRIFNALLRALEERKIKLWLDRGRTWVKFEGETIQIGLREKSSRHYLTAAEQAKLKKASDYSWYTPPNFVDEPNGRLSFFMKEEKESYYGYARTVEERPANPLENRVNDMIIALGRMAEALKIRRREKEERDTRWAKEAAEREVQESIRRLEQRRMDKFIEWAGQRQEACRLNSFLQELEGALQGLPENHEARDIYNVAQQRLIKMNPLTNGSIQNIHKPEYGYYR